MNVFLCVSLLTIISECLAQSAKPNIIIFIADDLGWNDVGFHGSNQIPTPNIDALAYDGLILHNYYVSPICSPSRSALMSGKHPIHTGMQHDVVYGPEPWGLPLTEKLLPEYLRDLGYETHLVGKWHLGHFRKEYTPTFRGFDSHYGYWTGRQDYYDHTAQEGEYYWGYDFRRDMEVDESIYGMYTTDVITDEAVKIIQNHVNSISPLFLTVAHLAVHSGNPYLPLQAPEELVEKFNISNKERRIFAGMLSKLDDSLGAVVSALQEGGMLDNSIIIFTTDNGGPAEGFNDNAASNWPLRGVKNTYWEGGVRGAAALWSPLVNTAPRVADQMMHIQDWLPTLISAAGGNSSKLTDIDGVDLWTALTNNIPSPRTEFLHNIDELIPVAALRVGDWKIINGTTYSGDWDSWYGPSGRNETYDLDAVLNCSVAQALQALGRPLNKEKIEETRQQTEIICGDPETGSKCSLLEAPCLFHIPSDPCEYNNLAGERPDIVQELIQRLLEYNETAVPPGNAPRDALANPRYWDYTWTNWMDYPSPIAV